MKRTILAAIATTILALTIAAPAHAYRDTTWGCPGCAHAPHHR